MEHEAADYALPLQCVEAFLIAFGVTLLELVTSKYPRTFFLIGKSVNLYAYVAIYGAAAALAVAVYPLISSQVSVTSSGGANPWVRPAIIGMTVKAFLHVRLFEVTTGPGKSTPVGIETVVLLFEPWLLTSISLDHYITETVYLQSRLANHADLAKAKSIAVGGIPNGFDLASVAAITNDLNNAASVRQVMSIYLKYVGKKPFENLFP